MLLACVGCHRKAHPQNRAEVLQRGLDVDLAATTSFSEGRPRYEQPLGDGLSPPEGLTSLSAESCGGCHAEIYAEWRISTHAAAWVDPQFQAEIRKSGNRWLCLNCHTPLRVQQDLWPVGLHNDDVEHPILAENPVFDPALRDEGITCVACHLRDGKIHGPGLTRPGLARPGLDGPGLDGPGLDGPGLDIGNPAPHTTHSSADYTDQSLCLRCHQAVARYPGKDFICVFDTGEEWRAGPWAEQGTGCTDCHMPRVTRPAAVGGPERSVARHWWRGAGIPKVAGVHPPDEALPPGLSLEADWGDHLSVTVENAAAGHLLPTGDPERWVQITVTFTGTGTFPGADAPPWEHRIGQSWEWWPEPRKLDDNRLAPLETRTLQVPIPQGAVSARVVVSSHRMSEETAAYHALKDYPLSIRTHALELTRP